MKTMMKVLNWIADRLDSLLAALVAGCLLIASGCAVVSAKTGKDGARYYGWAFGEKASSTLAGLNVTETVTDGDNVVSDRGVGLDKSGSNSETKVADILSMAIIRAISSAGQPEQPAPAQPQAPDVQTQDVE